MKKILILICISSFLIPLFLTGCNPPTASNIVKATVKNNMAGYTIRVKQDGSELGRLDWTESGTYEIDKGSCLDMEKWVLDITYESTVSHCFDVDETYDVN